MLRYQRTDSAALMYLVRTHSAGYAFEIKNNSNTMLRYQRTDSAALMYLVRTHSAGYAFGIKNNSNTMLRYQRTDSAALMYLVRTHSAGYAFGIKNNSNTMLRYQRTDSAALMYLVRTHSNAYKFGIKNNSNTLLYYHRTDSNAYAFGIKNNSNEICYLDSLIDVYSDAYTVASDTTISNLTFFKSGITVNASKTLTLNTPITSSGAINLNVSGSIALTNDLHLASGTTITHGGKIYGGGHAVFLHGDLSIPDGETVYLKSGTIIDGCNNSLDLLGSSVLSVDDAISVTLRNMQINLVSGTQITMVSPSSQLTLQNVVINLDGDFGFTNGRLYIEDDVIVKGRMSASPCGYVFAYRSNYPMYINPYATFYFDLGTAFRYIPGAASNRTTTHAASRSLINMSNRTSAIYLNGASLEAPVNGIALTKGSLILDNKVTFSNTDSDLYANSNRDYAITFGDGTAANDMDIYMLAGAKAEVVGYVDYNNAN
jgi:ribosome modulation factor